MAVTDSNYLYCYQQTGLIRVELSKDKGGKKPHMMERFTLLSNKDFDAVIIHNVSGAENTIRLFHGEGDYSQSQDQAVVSISNTTPIPVSLLSGSVTLNQANIANGALNKPDNSIGAEATEQIVTASVSNVLVRVTNLLENTDEMRVGTHSGVNANTGTPIHPGATWESNTAAGVWIYNSKNDVQSVAIEVETRT